MKKLLLLLPIALLLFNCTTESTGCPTIETYRTYGATNARYVELTLSDGSIVNKPLQVVEKKVGSTRLIGKEYCE